VGSGLFTVPDKASRGWANLLDPSLSMNGERASWAGNRSILVTRTPHTNSSLLSGVCKLLITGGGIHNTDIEPITKVSGDLASIALGFNVLDRTIDENVGYERLTDLLLQTIQGGLHPKMSWPDVIEALATQAERLTAAWGSTPGQGKFDERVRTAFGAYGFGRSVEEEDNKGNNIEANGSVAAKNVIAVGQNWQRPIKGKACCQDEDFFVLNEKVRKGDTVRVNVRRLNGAGKFRIRIFEKHVATSSGQAPPIGGVSCSFYHTAPPYVCELPFQVYPQPEPTGATPTNLESVTDTTPAEEVVYLREGGTTEDYYVAIAPAIGSPGGDYELSVKIERKAPAPYVPLQ
jgi:hypothetical protein